MHQTEKELNELNIDVGKEMADKEWYRIYYAVIITTIIVITVLWAFSRYFSN